MVLVLVLAAWLALGVVVAGLFVAVIRGGGGTDAAAEPVAALPVFVPGQRGVEAPVSVSVAR